MAMPSKETLYAPIPSDEEEHLSSKISYKNHRSRLLISYFVFIQLALISSVIYILYRPHISDYKLWPLELPSARNVVKYETIMFSPSGLSKTDMPATIYEGFPTEFKDALWHNLSSVGMYSLTTKEYKQLNHDFGLETAPLYDGVGSDGDYIVALEVFHQLHCLNTLRHAVYQVSDSNYEPEDQADERMTKIHLDHCVDYLRQVLMCHADLTPITFRYDKKKRPLPFVPDFNIKHTCRNWDAIWEFAAIGQRSKMVID